MTSDLELLQNYADQNSEEAFAELVRRHLDLVYSAALRQVCSPQLAEEVAQSVCTDLARNAGKLKPDTILTAWLYQVTRRTAIDVVRKESRRQSREQIAVEMTNMNAASSDWTHVEPFLDEAMHTLDETDRAAVLLRYFENKSFRDVGQTLGTSDDAAQKRVSRAVERLREFLAKRGVTVGASGLVVVISANAVQAAPVGLTATISAAVLAGTAVHTLTVITATKAIAMTTLQKTLVTATLAVVAGAGIYEARQASMLRTQVQTLQQQEAPLTEQIAQLQRERDDATNRLASLQAENAQLKFGQNSAELLKLRGEVTQLRNEANDPTGKAAKTVAAKVKLLKQRLEQMPDKKIPELQFVTEKDWADAAWDANLDTDDGVREALSKLRETAENTFLNEMMKAAFKKYLAANNDILPADLSQLKPYFDVPVTDAMLQHYELLQTGKPDNSTDLVKLVAYADEEYDSNHGMSINGAWGGRFNRVQQAVEAASNAFTVDNSGQMPNDPSQITPYLKMPIDAATIQKYLKQIAASPPPPEVATLAPALKTYSDAHNGQMPKNPSDLLPYLTTPQQRAALQKLEQNNPASK